MSPYWEEGLGCACVDILTFSCSLKNVQASSCAGRKDTALGGEDSVITRSQLSQLSALHRVSRDGESAPGFSLGGMVGVAEGGGEPPSFVQKGPSLSSGEDAAPWP